MPPHTDPDFTVSLPLTGSGAVDAAAYAASLKSADAALGWLRDQAKTNALELLGVPSRTDDLDSARGPVAALAHGAAEIAVLGIGGSSLGGQALTALQRPGRGLRVRFFDNPDPFSWSRALETFDLPRTRFIAISKSGGTAETLFQALTAADALRKAGVQDLKNHFLVITEPKPSALAAFADSIGAAKLAHPLGVGGRYSVLTLVGMVPALLMGLDVGALRAGAAATLDAVLNAPDAAAAPAAAGAALHHALAQTARLDETVLFAYADAAHVLGGWWRQLWAESLGKDGKGSTPVSALGPVDQHSQLQLFRDGPGRSLYTFITTDTRGHGPVAPADAAKKLGLDYLAGRHMGDLVDAEARATQKTLAGKGRAVRVIHAPVIDERHMGALMMHFMLETILMGRLMGVDPFDQPGVEEAKILARQYLGEG